MRLRCTLALTGPFSLPQVLTFIDMGGHEKYLKTALYGMTCMLPDYVMLCVSAAAGVQRMTREHLAVAVALEIPVAVALTKVDAVHEAQLQRVTAEVSWREVCWMLRTLLKCGRPVLCFCNNFPSDDEVT